MNRSDFSVALMGAALCTAEYSVTNTVGGAVYRGEERQNVAHYRGRLVGT